MWNRFSKIILLYLYKMTHFKCIKKILHQKRLMRLMKLENNEVRKYCGKRDWGNAQLWLEKNKMSFKAYRKIEKL